METSQDGSDISIRTNSSGTIANRVLIDHDGKIGINLTNPGDYNSSANNLVVHSSPSVNDAGITIRSNYAGSGGLYFADGTGTSSDKGYIIYGQANDTMYLGVNRGSKLQINSSGAFGLAGSNYGSSGQVLTSQGSGSAVQWATPVSGKILKVHSVSSTSHQTITSSSFTDLTNLSITLTPASNSKCYVHVVVNGYAEGYNTFHVTNTAGIFRDSTEIAKSIRGIRLQTNSSTDYLQNQSPIVMSILDTHGKDGSTSVTYKVRGKTNHGSMFVNTSFNTQSSITVYEVAPN